MEHHYFVDLGCDGPYVLLIPASAYLTTVWSFSVHSSNPRGVRGSFRIKHTYLGPTDRNYKVPHVNGAYTTTDCTWSSPAASIKAGQEISLKVTGAATVRTHAWPQPYVGLIAQIVTKNAKGEYVSQLRTFKNQKRQSMMMVGSGTGFKPFDETVSAVFPRGGKVGETLGVKVTVSSGNAQASAVYIYIWGPPAALRPPIKDY